MSHIAKPAARHPGQPVNNLGFAERDYEGGMSTLCAGCGHDSITAALVKAFFELDIEPHRVAKLSGIGCSSKTPAYFLSASHGFNSVHGRMPSVVTGANAAERSMAYVGVSGDGDSLSIGIGQFAHAVRRNLNMLYIIENNGVYGLTKGQFSASADLGSKPKKGAPNQLSPIDPVNMAISMGASFVARSFSGDKDQLVPLIKAGIRHDGFALIDVISPCVTFNDHDGSTKSYQYTRDNIVETIHTDFVPPRQEITVDFASGEVTSVRLHDGSHMLLKKVDKAYNADDRAAAISYIQHHQSEGRVVTGLLYFDGAEPEFHQVSGTCQEPLRDLPHSDLCPGSEALAELMKGYR